MKPVIEFHSEKENVKPMYACGHCRLLGAIIDRNNSREAAENCCLCERCGVAPKQLPYIHCAECQKAWQSEQHAAEYAKLEALPEVEWDGNPIYAHNGDRYDKDLDCLVELYDEDELASLIVHPCRVEKVHPPDLVDYVETYLSDQYQDGDGPYLDEKYEKALTEVADSLPVRDVWIPITNVRLRRCWLVSDSEPAQ